MSRLNQAPKIDFQTVKRDLVEDLDQFLLEENLTPPQRQIEKQKALEELDKLIQQDLSYHQILSSVKKEIKDKKPPQGPLAPTSSLEFSRQPIQPSSHVLDLRKNKSEPTLPRPAKDKKSFWGSKPKIEPKKTAQFHIPADKKKFTLVWPTLRWPSLGLAGQGGKILVFALILTIVLLPLRGLWFFGQLQIDNDKIIGFGKVGLLNLRAGIISASENSYDSATVDFASALENFSQAQSVLNQYEQWMLDAARQLPVVGKSLSLSQNLLTVATNISQAAATLSSQADKPGSLTDYVAFVRQQIAKTLPFLIRANDDLDHISITSLPSNFQPYFSDLKNYLPSTVANLKTLEEILDFSLNFLGQETEKRYLVLFQNNNELRATGGFIGSYSLVDVYQGKITQLETPSGGTYDLTASQTTKIKSPAALALISPYFNIWDANWWPDFPTSAKKIISLYENSGNSSVDGAIAINAQVLQGLLKVLGPISLADYGVTIGADNFYDVLQTQIEIKAKEEGTAPKKIISDLVPVVLEKLLTDQSKQKEVMALLADMLATKEIQIYSQDPAVQAKINSFGWSGQILQNNRDYLFVVNTNIGGGKTDNGIYQTIDHQAEIKPNGEIIDTLKITRVNKGGTDNPLAGLEGGNVSYLRVYVPLDSTLLSAIGFDQIPKSYSQVVTTDAKIDEDLAKEEIKMIDAKSGTEIYQSFDKTVLANWLTLRPGESKTVLLKYRLPFKLKITDPLVDNWWQKIFQGGQQLDNYSLLAQAQSGSQQTIFNSAILLPANLKVVYEKAMGQTELGLTNNLVTYSSDLKQDQYFGFIVASQ
jgi:hypothetical protein